MFGGLKLHIVKVLTVAGSVCWEMTFRDDLDNDEGSYDPSDYDDIPIELVEAIL